MKTITWASHRPPVPRNGQLKCVQTLVGKGQGGRTNFHKHLLWEEPQRGTGLCLSCTLALLRVSEAVTVTVGSRGRIRITERPKLTISETGEPGILTSPTGGLAIPNPLRAPGARCWLGHFFLAP